MSWTRYGGIGESIRHEWWTDGPACPIKREKAKPVALCIYCGNSITVPSGTKLYADWTVHRPRNESGYYIGPICGNNCCQEIHIWSKGRGRKYGLMKARATRAKVSMRRVILNRQFDLPWEMRAAFRVAQYAQWVADIEKTKRKRT